MEKMSIKNPFRASQQIPEAPDRVSESSVDRQLPSLAQLIAIQERVINALTYNFLPSTFFCLEKNRPLQRILATAKEIIQESLPIRCLEATFLGIYLTMEMKDVERLPISFKSRATSGGQTHRHIVLAVRHRGLFGAVGLSRSESLMYKPVAFTSLVDLIEEYRNCYRQVGHVLVSLKVGLYVSHDALSKVPPCWRYISIGVPNGPIREDPRTSSILDNFESLLPMMSEQYIRQQTSEMQQQLHPSSSVLNGLPQSSLRNQAASREGNNDDDEGAVSDTEENQRRIAVIVSLRSPFGSIVPELSGGKDRQRFTARFRRDVQTNPYNASSPAAAAGQQRSRTVPAAPRLASPHIRPVTVDATDAPPLVCDSEDSSEVVDTAPPERKPSPPPVSTKSKKGGRL